MKRRLTGIFLLATVFVAVSMPARASVLPDDRTDMLYHLYTGGGVDIDGPSVLVRKKVHKNVSLVGNYYVDLVSSASIDVITTASPYKEERTQWSIGADYLRGNTTLRANYVSSVESDFDAKTYAFSVSQDMFGAMTTLTLGYAYGADIVGRSDDPTFRRDNRRQQYSIGLTQILSRNLITSVSFDTTTDEGFLNNPYRSVRYFDPGTALGYSYEPELYPNTRTSNAVGVRARYYLPYRAAIEGEYRFFTDTWDLKTNTASVSYIHPLGPWTFTGKFRWHDQNSAAFYRDLFPRAQATNFRGRDKELSALTSLTFKAKVSYKFIDENRGYGFLKKGTVNASLDFLMLDYHDFSDLSTGAPLGEEPLFSMNAAVIQLFVSFWY